MGREARLKTKPSGGKKKKKKGGRSSSTNVGELARGVSRRRDDESHRLETPARSVRGSSTFPALAPGMSGHPSGGRFYSPRRRVLNGVQVDHGAAACCSQQSSARIWRFLSPYDAARVGTNRRRKTETSNFQHQKQRNTIIALRLADDVLATRFYHSYHLLPDISRTRQRALATRCGARWRDAVESRAAAAYVSSAASARFHPSAAAVPSLARR